VIIHGPDPDVWIDPVLHSLPRPVLGRALLAAVLASVFALGAATPVVADETDEQPTVRWSVTPADENGPDGRTAVEHDVDPGETISDHFAVRNVSEETVTFRLAAADGFFTRTGRFDMLPADQESVDSGTWITIPDEVTVAAGETEVIPFEIVVPETAEPGDHAAGITASILSIQSGDDGASVGVESRVGFRVLTRVTGEITPAAEVEGIAPSYALSWNPFRPGEMTVTFDVVNAGNTRLVAEGTVHAGGQSVAFPAEGDITQELLPGDTRTITVVVDDVWPLFLVPVEVAVDPVVVTMDGSTSDIDTVRSDATAWAMPWPQLILLAGLALVIGALVWGRRRSQKRLESMLETAREEGRRSATSVEDAS
jgi:hypothetical protein